MKAKLRNLILIVFATVTNPAQAYKLDFIAGGFSLTAETSSGSGSKSGLGAYKFTYSIPVTSNLEFGLGYTLIFSDTFTGDASFGLDIETSYFPFSSGAAVDLSTTNTSVRMTEIWSPFIGAGYHQRQFQSVQTQYNGFSVAFGLERALTENVRIKGMCRYLFMNGANEATATIMDVMAGASFQF